MKKGKIIGLSILLIGIIGLVIIGFNMKNKETTTSTSISDEITYSDTDEVPDFSDCEEVLIDLNTAKEVDITKYGVYVLTGTYDGTINVNLDDNALIILKDTNIKSSTGPAIYVENAKNVYIQFINDNTLEDSSSYSGYEDDVDGVIFSHDDLIMYGTGTITLTGNHGDGIVSKDDLKLLSGTYNITTNDDGIRGKDSVVIKDGVFNITSKGDGIKSTETDDTSLGYILIDNGSFNIKSTLDGLQAETKVLINGGTFDIKTNSGASNSSNTNSNWGYFGSSSNSTESAKGIKAGNNIVITNGEFNIDSSDDSIHSNASIGISGGTFTIASGDDGIHADSDIIIDDGNISITKCYEGIESTNITINNGYITIVSSDDGINISGGNDSSSIGGRPGQNNFANSSNGTLTINDGYIYVNSAGDGLDANGSILMNNGTVLIDGPEDSGNGALDYDTTFTVNNGLLVAVGSSGMAQNITGGDANSIAITLSNQSANTIINIDGVLTYKPSKRYSSIVIASSNLVKGNSYELKLGGSDTGTIQNGLYTGGTYSGGTTYTTFSISSNVNSTGGNSTNNGGFMRR